LIPSAYAIMRTPCLSGCGFFIRTTHWIHFGSLLVGLLAQH
jgi:hypothetical protein